MGMETDAFAIADCMGLGTQAPFTRDHGVTIRRLIHIPFGPQTALGKFSPSMFSWFPPLVIPCKGPFDQLVCGVSYWVH